MFDASGIHKTCTFEASEMKKNDYQTQCRLRLLRPNEAQTEPFWLPKSNRPRLLHLKMAQDGAKITQDDFEMVQNGAKMAPRWAQDGFKMCQGGVKMAQDGVKIASRWAKMDSRWLQMVSR